jgi:hypothetical protein
MPATSGKSWQENKISRDILEEEEPQISQIGMQVQEFLFPSAKSA